MASTMFVDFCNSFGNLYFSFDPMAYIMPSIVSGISHGICVILIWLFGSYHIFELEIHSICRCSHLFLIIEPRKSGCLSLRSHG